MTESTQVVLGAGEALELLRLAVECAESAGSLIVQGRRERVEVAATKSSPTDVVTEMDHAAEDLLRRGLAGARPQDGLLGEERGFTPGTSGLTWVLDPIDGTVNYLYGLASYSVSVALVSGDPRVDGGWVPVVGCVHAPAMHRTWTAVAGGGAWLNGHPLRMSPAPALDRALVGTGFGYRAERRRSQARVFAGLLPRIRDIRRMGSAAIDLCSVACGELDAYYERGVNVWDIAAATLVVREAGGKVVGLRGAPPSPQLTLAAGPGLVDVLAGELAALDADRD